MQYSFAVSNIVKISAVVTNFNGLKLGLLEDFFNSFLKNDFKDFELFFVDNASEDNSIKFVQENYAKDNRIKIIKNPINVMSKGINMALNEARGKYILFLNNDIYFAKGAIFEMVKFMDKNPDVALVQGKLVLYSDHKKIDDVGETMDIYGNPITLGAREKDLGQYDRQQEVLSVTGAASLFRSGLLEKIGKLDPDYGIGYEDLDLALRARLAGYKVVYLPQSLIFHKRGSSVSQASESVRLKIKYGFNKNRLSTLIKNYQVGTLLKVLPLVIVLYLGTGFFEIIYKKLWRFGLSRFQAIGWMILNTPTLLTKRKGVQSLRRISDREAIYPFLAKGHFLVDIKNFLSSKKW